MRAPIEMRRSESPRARPLLSMTSMLLLAGALFAWPAAAARAQATDPSIAATFRFGGRSDAFAFGSSHAGGWLVAGWSWNKGQFDTGVARLTPSGTLDPAFAAGGRLTVSMSKEYESADAVAAAADGSAFVAGCADRAVRRKKGECDAFVLKLLANGSPDPAFGTRGRAYLRTSDRDRAWELASAIRPGADGSAVIAGLDQRGLFLMRVLPDGRADPAFGVAGVARPLGRHDVFEAELLVDEVGRLLLAGTYEASGRLRYAEDDRDFDLVVARLMSDGSLDPSFGQGGKTVLGVGSEASVPDYDSLETLMLTGEHLYLAGHGGGYRPVVARLTAAGQFDATYGEGGWWRAPAGGEGMAGAFDPSGRAWLLSSNGLRTRAWHLAADGVLTGSSRLDFARRHEIVRAAATDVEGGAVVIVVGGGSSDYSGDIIVGRVPTAALAPESVPAERRRARR